MADFSDDFAGWPPEGVLFPLDDASLEVCAGDHPFHAANAAAAAENWTVELARKPALFDGKIVFQHRLVLGGGILRGEAYVTSYSTFLLWRSRPGGEGAIHLFAFPVLVASDGALVAIRMGGKTLNAGQVYFAAGSLDPDDVVGGYCDIDGNMRREVMEETGLDLAVAEADAQLYASHQGRHVTLYRLFRFAMTADEMVAAIRAHHDEEEEVEDAVAIRSGDPALHAYSAAMLPFIRWYFDGMKDEKGGFNGA